MAARLQCFWWDPKDDMYPLVIDALYEADKKGYSVLELRRILGFSNCRALYNMMRNAGIYTKLERRKGPKIDTPPALAVALKSCDISFLQWANSHNIDADASALALKSIADPTNPVSVAAHAALEQDFKFFSAKMFEAAVPLPRASVWDSSLTSEFTLSIESASTKGQYRAFVHGRPDCDVVAATRDLAYTKLKSRCLLFHSLNKLKLLLPK